MVACVWVFFLLALSGVHVQISSISVTCLSLDANLIVPRDLTGQIALCHMPRFGVFPPLSKSLITLTFIHVHKNRGDNVVREPVFVVRQGQMVAILQRAVRLPG